MHKWLVFYKLGLHGTDTGADGDSHIWLVFANIRYPQKDNLHYPVTQ